MNLCICGKKAKNSFMSIWICGRLYAIHDNEECANHAYEFWESNGDMKEDNQK